VSCVAVHARGHVTVRARACVDVRCRTQCEPDWKPRLTSADTHLQPTHADSTGGAYSAPPVQEWDPREGKIGRNGRRVGEGKGRREEKRWEGRREGIRQVSRPTGGLRGKGAIPPKMPDAKLYAM